MVELATTLRLLGHALGAFGAVLVFVELFQMPGYVIYDRSAGDYRVDTTPGTPTEYTWIGRIGALLVAAAFATLFLSEFLGAGLA